MLLYQGVKSFEIWTGKKAPVEVMKRALVMQSKSIDYRPETIDIKGLQANTNFGE